jgi:hypothetical protein
MQRKHSTDRPRRLRLENPEHRQARMVRLWGLVSGGLDVLAVGVSVLLR